MTEAQILVLGTLVATLISTASMLLLRSTVGGERLARMFYGFVVAISILSLLYTVLTLRHSIPFYVAIHRVLFYRLWLTIGVALSSAILINTKIGRRYPAGTSPIDSFIRSENVLRGLCFAAAFSFLTIEIGKLGNDAEMRTFFLQSGYSVAFMYLTMVAEILGALGLFLRTFVVPSACALALIMGGAILTHWRNHDPLSDSTDALYLLISLLCIVVLSLRRPDRTAIETLRPRQ